MKVWIVIVMVTLMSNMGDAFKTDISQARGRIGHLPEEIHKLTLPHEVSENAFVRVQDYIPDIVVDLRYATEHNFTGKVIYDFQDAYLRYGTVKKLKRAQKELAEQGLSIKIWDAFRPVDAQWKLWEAYPNPAYVANPNNGITSHSRGDTIDITLVDTDGNDVKMPTGFDDFSSLADRDYSDCDEKSAYNAKLLEGTMLRHGFTGYRGEWWDFSDTDRYSGNEDFYPPVL